MNALRLCLDPLIPPRREQPIEIEVRKLESVEDAQYVVADIIAAAAGGKITLSGAAELVRLIEVYVKTCEASVRERQAQIKEAEAVWQRDEFLQNLMDNMAQ